LREDSLAQAALETEELDAFAQRSQLWNSRIGELRIVGFG
jgi:hypothetical protein